MVAMVTWISWHTALYEVKLYNPEKKKIDSLKAIYIECVLRTIKRKIEKYSAEYLT